MLGNSNCIKRILDDASVLSVIDAAQIGILARLNKLVYNIGLLSHSNTTSKNVTTKRPNVAGAKKQSIEQMVSMVPENFLISALSQNQLKCKHLRKHKKSNQSLKRIKKEEPNTIDVRTESHKQIKKEVRITADVTTLDNQKLNGKLKYSPKKRVNQKENISDDYNKTNINALKVEKIDDVLLHEREQLGLYELFIDVNKPLKIDETFVRRSISISWLRKFDHDNGDGFYVFDVGIISNVHHNTVQICFQGYEKSYKVVLDLNDWTSCAASPPMRPFQWRLLSKKASFFPVSFIVKCLFLNSSLFNPHCSMT